MEPSFHSGGDDFLETLGPPEWPRVAVVFGEEAIDGGLEFEDGSEHATLETPLGQGAEEALDSIEPSGRGGSEVKRPTRMPNQPCTDLGVLVGGIIVRDGVGSVCRQARWPLRR